MDRQDRAGCNWLATLVIGVLIIGIVAFLFLYSMGGWTFLSDLFRFGLPSGPRL